MEKLNFFKRAVETLFGSLGGRKFDQFDAGILTAMLMLAAVDGDISKDELDRFRELAEGCKGCNEKSFAELWDAALHSAGYLLLQTKLLSREELVETFVREAERPFVSQVMQEVAKDRERAFHHLECLAASDGDYSDIERACIGALVERVKQARDRAMAERFSRAAVYKCGLQI